VVLGEIGLTGEVRAVSRVASRVAEAAKMGFERCLMPGHNVQHVKSSGKMELIGLQGVSEVVDLLF
jgi:DNA repair protein RadA/Sms